LYGDSITFDRSLFTETSDKSLINVPGYVKILCVFQAHAIAASQCHMASVIDNRTTKSNYKSVRFKVFNPGDYVIHVNDLGDKLHYNLRGPYQVVARNEANIYSCKDLRTNEEIKFDVASLRLFICPPNVKLKLFIMILLVVMEFRKHYVC